MSIVFQDYDAQTGIKSVVHELDSGKTVIQKTYDAEPFVQFASDMRTQTEGDRWGEFRHVGSIPMAELATMLRQDGGIDMKRVSKWLKKERPDLVTFSKFLK